MNAKKCDRCTKFYEPYTPNDSTKNCNTIIFAEEYNDRYLEYNHYELCPECMKDACRFMFAKIR